MPKYIAKSPYVGSLVEVIFISIAHSYILIAYDFHANIATPLLEICSAVVTPKYVQVSSFMKAFMPWVVCWTDAIEQEL